MFRRPDSHVTCPKESTETVFTRTRAVEVSSYMHICAGSMVWLSRQLWHGLDRIGARKSEEVWKLLNRTTRFFDA